MLNNLFHMSQKANVSLWILYLMVKLIFIFACMPVGYPVYGDTRPQDSRPLHVWWPPHIPPLARHPTPQRPCPIWQTWQTPHYPCQAIQTHCRSQHRSSLPHPHSSRHSQGKWCWPHPGERQQVTHGFGSGQRPTGFWSISDNTVYNIHEWERSDCEAY